MYARSVVVIVKLSLIASICSCGALAPLGHPRSFGKVKHLNEADRAEALRVHCIDQIRNPASSRAQLNMYLGFGSGILGVASAGTATVLITADRDPSDRVRAIQAAAPLVSAVFFALAKSFFAREDAASELAKQAGMGMTAGKEEEQWDRCTNALAAWDSSRTEATKIAETLQTIDRAKDTEPKP